MSSHQHSELYREVQLLTFCCSCCRGNCLVLCLGEWYQTGECDSGLSTGGRCTDGPPQRLVSQWCPDKYIVIRSKVFQLHASRHNNKYYIKTTTTWLMFLGIPYWLCPCENQYVTAEAVATGLTETNLWRCTYHNSLMLHIGHDNHHVVLLPEAVCHPHHILSASEKRKKTHWSLPKIITKNTDQT